MKKPEEIKKGLECCANLSFCDEECPYFEECNEGLESHASDALALIQQLEAENERLLNSYDAALCEAADMLVLNENIKQTCPELHEKWVLASTRKEDAHAAD